MEKITTLTQHLLSENKGELNGLLSDIALIAKILSREINRAGLIEILGLTGDINIQGEEVRQLDVYGQNLFVNVLSKTGHIALMGSEEEKNLIPTNNKNAPFVILFDPLDGCSNYNVNVSIGSIFSIYKKRDGSDADLLQIGRDQLVAGYVIYGSSTMLVYTAGNGVHGFTLDPGVGEFLLSHGDIKIPNTLANYSVNESYFDLWDDGVQKFVFEARKVAKARHIGSLVADFHRNLLQGGIHLYPGQIDKPEGKLRLLYECNPLSFIAEQAGGMGSNGKINILDIVPEKLHQRTPFFIGNIDAVKKIEHYLSN